MAKPGRPTKYDPGTMIPRMLELAAEGAGRLEICAELDVDLATYLKYEQQYPEFFKATTRARELSQAWWEAQGRKGVWSREFNAPAYSLQVRNRFPRDWRDKHDHELSGPDGSPVPLSIQIELVDASED
jgi:hypothetical protein